MSTSSAISNPTSSAPPSLLDGVIFPAAVLTLAAAISAVSQSTLAPVFGAIPSSVSHSPATTISTLLGFLLRSQFKHLPPRRVAQLLAIWAFYVPLVQMYLFPWSSVLGLSAGPTVSGLLSSHIIILAASYTTAEELETLRLQDRIGTYVGPLCLTLVAVLHVLSFDSFFRQILPGLRLLSDIFTPVKLHLVLATFLAYLTPSRLLLLILPALAHTFLLNPHFDSATTDAVLNATLHTHNWSLVDRTWSNTGYLSVLDNLDQDYRILRCDHSLLGGEWLLTPSRQQNEGWTVKEPLYAVFSMLEAVRLIPDPPIPDSSANALVIGLGIGTAPKSLIQHGINTTILELDPAVHTFATKFFDLPANHTSVIHDAVTWVSSSPSSNRNGTFDYILHDTFTGGACPLSLYTFPFLSNLRALLTPEGVIAINYAGDLSLPLTRKILHTVSSAFEGHCRIYRDTAAESVKAMETTGGAGDFANIVAYCRNPTSSSSSSSRKIEFREPNRQDWLGSKSKEHYLVPSPDLEIEMEGLGEKEGGEGVLLGEAEEVEWTAQQVESAKRHWQIMRHVVPAAIWELW